MQCCKDCGSKMVGVMSFSKGKQEKFRRCPKYYSETKHQFLILEEVLDREIHKRK